MMQYPSDAHWSATRPAVMYVTKMDGSIDVWDFLFRYRMPTLNVMVPIMPTLREYTVFRKKPTIVFLRNS